MALREDALHASYRRLEKPLYNVLYRMLWQAEDCQDLIHDAYLRIWARRAKVDVDTLDRLVWTTALNLARNRLRWRRLWRFGSLDEGAPLAAASGESDFLAVRCLRRALAALPAASREVLLLAEFSGLRGAEIAALLDIPAGTVASRKHQAIARLKQSMGVNDDA